MTSKQDQFAENLRGNATTTSIQAIISVLEHAKERPGMYGLHYQKMDGVAEFLNGFNMGCQTLGYTYTMQAFKEIYTKRGWEQRGSLAELICQQTGLNMKDGGLSEQEIVAELFAIEIECWQSLLTQAF